MAEWSTETVGAHERYAYWREAICRSVFNLAVEAPPGPFTARMSTLAAGPLRMARGETSRYDAIRGSREVANDSGDHYMIYLQLQGDAVISQRDTTYTCRPHDLAISDLQHQFHARLSAGRRITTVIPSEMIDRRAPWVRKTALRHLSAASPYVDLARRHIETMVAGVSDSAAVLLSENLCNLLALASAPEVAPGRLAPELQIEAMLAFCRQHVADGELTPQRVADHLGVSVRTLHLRFKDTGQTFGRWLLEERLAACARALRDPALGDRNISEIAYRWGFNDLSHFNKSFRARFGMTPGDWRHATRVLAAE